MKHTQKQAAFNAARAEYKQAADRIHQITAAIADHAGKLADIAAHEERLAALKNQLEDLAAEAALGKDVEKAREETAAKITTVSSTLATLETARAAASGLERKLIEAKQEMAGLQAASDKALVEFLKEEAEALGEEYAAAASKTVNLYKQLMAIDNLLGPSGFIISYRPGHMEKINLPAFILEAHKGSVDSLIGPVLPASAELTQEHFMAALATERTRLQRAGLDLQ